MKQIIPRRFERHDVFGKASIRPLTDAAALVAQIVDLVRSQLIPVLIALVCVCLLTTSWLPTLSFSQRMLVGHVGLLGLLGAVSLNGRTIKALKRHAIIDPLTGLVSRAFLEKLMTRHLNEAVRYGEHAAAIFVDIDHFKQVNDRYGHQSGDEVLRAVARKIQECIRACDTVARYGGDEFVVFLPRTDRAAVGNVAERVHAAVETLASPLPGQAEPCAVTVTISAGVAVFPEDGTDPKSLLQHADESLYTAKRSGRNGVVLCDPAGFGQATGERVQPCEA